MKLTGILLAAGASRRLGRDKRRLRLPNGETLLNHCAARLHAVTDDIVVVVRPEDDALADALQAAGCRVCRNPTPELGMGKSLSCGIAISSDSDGWLIQPCDLPLVRLSTLRGVGAHLQHADAVIPFCHGRRGHPVGFTRHFREPLLRLTGDQGGRQVLRDAKGKVLWLNLHDPGIYRDIDDTTDVATIERHMRLQMPE